MTEIVYFSKMFQAVPHLAQVESVLPGVFVSNRLSTLRAVRSLYPGMPNAAYSRLFGSFTKGNKLLEKADIIVTGSPYRSFLAPYTAKKCTVFHGTYMLLSKEALRRNAHFDLLCIIGPRMLDMMSRFGDEIRAKSVQTGFLPFCEYPERNATARDRLMNHLRLDPGRRTVVYTPSRRGIGSWDLLAERMINEAPADFNLILRPHPSQALTGRHKDRAGFRKIRTLAESRGNTLLDLTSIALPHLFSIADLVVSDANSPTEESLFYDLPQLLVESPLASREALRRHAQAEETHPEDIARLMTLYECGPLLDALSPHRIGPRLEEAISDSARFARQRADYFSWVFGKRDRSANQRVGAAITQYLIN